MKLITAVFFLGVMIVSSCNNPKGTGSTKSCCAKDKPDQLSKDIPGESVFNLDTRWITQNRDTIYLNHFRGKVTVAAMVFTHCESACPRIVADMQRIESALSGKEFQHVSFLLISMDPERDSPERMREFAGEHQLNSNWTLICSNEDATMEMANVLNVRVKKLEGGGFDHSNIIHVINREGIIVHQQNGFAVEQSETLQAIRALL
jgi:protein SCO1